MLTNKHVVMDLPGKHAIKHAWHVTNAHEYTCIICDPADNLIDYIISVASGIT